MITFFIYGVNFGTFYVFPIQKYHHCTHFLQRRKNLLVSFITALIIYLNIEDTKFLSAPNF